MSNPTYQQAVSELSQLFGKPHDLESGNGARFTSASRGRVTIYHREIGTGNQAEIAFEIESLAKRLKKTPNEIRSLIATLRSGTGRPTDPNPQHGWPRVGLSTGEHVGAVCSALAQAIEKVKA